MNPMIKPEGPIVMIAIIIDMAGSQSNTPAVEWETDAQAPQSPFRAPAGTVELTAIFDNEYGSYIVLNQETTSTSEDGSGYNIPAQTLYLISEGNPNYQCYGVSV